MEWCGCNLPAAECSVSILTEFVPMIYELMLPLGNYIEERKKRVLFSPVFSKLHVYALCAIRSNKALGGLQTVFSAGKMQLFRAGSSI